MTTNEHTQAQLDSITRQRSGSYVFHGRTGAGKADAALALAKRLNCLGDNGSLCSRCRQLAAGTYPDLIILKPEDKPSITIEQVRVAIQSLSYSLYYADGTRIFLVHAAHRLTIEAQNALLKPLEEPPPRTIFVLLTDRVESLLPTVRSRCAALYFPQHGAPRSDASDAATSLTAAPTLSLFDRLVLAKRLTDDKADLLPAAEALHMTTVTQLREGAIDNQVASKRLAALDLYRRQLQAKLAPRVALERLMLEL